MSSQLTIYNNARFGHHTVPKATVEHEATEAARAGLSLEDACRYPFASEAGMHFKAVYLLALPKSQPLPKARPLHE